jgi:hypothetical protein
MVAAGELTRMDISRYTRQGFPEPTRAPRDKEILVTWNQAPHGAEAKLFVDRFRRIWIVEGEARSLDNWPRNINQPAIRTMHARVPIPDGHELGGLVRVFHEPPRTHGHAAVRSPS